MNCTRCEGTGFLNLHQTEKDGVWDGDIDLILLWIDTHNDHDVQICDCCGDGDMWYGEPGEHYGSDDPVGRGGPYEYNGGLCECN